MSKPNDKCPLSDEELPEQSRLFTRLTAAPKKKRAAWRCVDKWFWSANALQSSMAMIKVTSSFFFCFQ
jgi:hypothetical protein